MSRVLPQAPVVNNPVNPYQIQALLSDLQSGDVSQGAAQQAAQYLGQAGVQSDPNWQYSTPNAAGGLNYSPLNYQAPTPAPTTQYDMGGPVPGYQPAPASTYGPNFQPTPLYTGPQPNSSAQNTQPYQPAPASTYGPGFQPTPLYTGPQTALTSRLQPATATGGQGGPAYTPRPLPTPGQGLPLGTSVPGVNQVPGSAPVYAGLPSNVTAPPAAPTAGGGPAGGPLRQVGTTRGAPTGTAIPPNTATPPTSTFQPGSVGSLQGYAGNPANANLPGSNPYGGVFAGTGNPVVPNTFTPEFTNQYFNTANTVAGNIGAEYQNAPWTTMNAAQMNTGQVPQPQATLPQNFQALQTLLSGQGFTPSAIAAMNAQAVDANQQAEAGTMSVARQAAERAGLLNSGLGIGMQANIANQAGIANQQALNQIQIANAQQAMSNMQTGAGIQAGMNVNSAQQANQVALQNAANMYNAMTQNLANQQATNTANFAGQQQKALGQAQAQSGYTGGAGQNYQGAQTGQYVNANIANANLANQQWTTGANTMGNLANMSGPQAANYGTSVGAATGTTANTALGQAASAYGAGGTNPVTGRPYGT